MKWLMILMLISAIMLIAMSVSEQYRDKFDFYTNLKLFLTQFKINIAFRQEKVLDFLNTIKCKKQFSLFVSDYKEYLNTGEIKLDNIKVLDEEDRVELENIIKSLGKHDVSTEIGQVEAIVAGIEAKLTKAETDKNKLCPMIIKLSLLFAVGLAILLI